MRPMKDSGVEWIGEIPQTWTCIKNKYLLDGLYSGGTPTASNDGFYCYDNGTPFVSISDMSNVDYVVSTQRQLTESGIADKQLKKQPVGTILYSIYATVGAISELKIEAVISQAMLALKLGTHVNKAFYKYNLRAMKDYIFSQANGNTQFNLNAEKVKNFYFTLPDGDEQQRIAEYLDAKCAKIDALIAKQQEIIEKLKAYKLSVITEAVTKGLNPNVPMKDSGYSFIGNIPKHWLPTKLKHITLAIGDGIHATPDYDEDGEYFFLNGNSIGQDQLVFKENTDKLNEVEFRKYRSPLLTDDTILITLNGATYGKTSFYHGEKVLLGKSAGYITLKSGVSRQYVRYYLQSRVAKIIMELSLCGSTIANLSLGTLNNFFIPLPNIEEQKEIAGYLNQECDRLDSIIGNREQMISKLTEYKKSLIYEVVTGKREVI